MALLGLLRLRAAVLSRGSQSARPAQPRPPRRGGCGRSAQRPG